MSAPEPQTELAEAPPPPKPQPERKPPVRVTQSTPPARPAAASVEHSASGQFVRVPIERVDELVRMVAELVVHRSTLEQQYSRYSRELGEHDLTTGRLRRLAVRLEDDFAARALMAVQSTHPTDGRRALTPDPVQGAAGEFDELEFDRYSEFHLLSRDVTETASDLVSAGVQLRSVGEDFRQALHRFGRVTGGVQDLLMRMRMMQVGSIETRLHRTVRVAATKRSKNVRFTVVGADVELDKTLLAEMTGPLEHILRNAVDHGLESPAERVKASKPVQGAITLEASLDGHRALLRISDDGKGLNPAKIRTRAIEMGRYSSAQVDDMADEELFELVFQPGFTTAEEVSEISGRGVGLDAVRAAVNKLGGSISITSELGKGATFVIGLPTSLAVTRVLLVQAGGRRFCMPAHAVDKVARGKITPGDGERRATVEVDGRRLPAYRLTDALHLAAEQQAEREQPILVVEAGERRYALAVDEVMEARDAVVKALGPLLSGAAGISAATVLGDGSVALILNPAELPDAEAKIAVRGPRPVQESGLHVLMADDSISVRRVLMKTFESAGWRFTAARDGKDALEKLRELDHPPDVALLDVEMPKMDGFQLTSALRAMPEYADLPIVMLTSRAGEKHRRKAQELGANDYLVKPYIEDVLLGALRRAARRKPAA
ncbi:MAG: response regulator [Acidobacteria bacterium]|nr:response regulator [Acidobacteriota bacterium]